MWKSAKTFGRRSHRALSGPWPGPRYWQTCRPETSPSARQTRRALCAAQSGKCLAAYLYSAAGHGESTTDLAWDGHAIIYENNELLAESQRFSDAEQLIVSDVHLKRLPHVSR